MSLEIIPADPSEPDIQKIVKAHLEYGHVCYPNESCHHLTPEQLQEIDLMLFSAVNSNRCVGISGLQMITNTTAELKSMHVLEHARGCGVGEALLRHIIEQAKKLGLHELYLGTGSRAASAAARRLYRRTGFSYCAPFGNYSADPESVYMKRGLLV